MERFAVIGDIHGFHDPLMRLLEKLPKDIKEENIYFCGDLIDRGPDSRKLLEWAIKSKHKICRGNHEDMMSKSPNRQWFQDWMNNGGDETLAQYSDNEKELLDQHIRWCTDLPLYYELPKMGIPTITDKVRPIVISHACIIDYWAHHKDKEYMYDQEVNIIWNRDPVFSVDREIYNIFGHTPQKNHAEILTDYACIDRGPHMHWQKGYSAIDALILPDMFIVEELTLF